MKCRGHRESGQLKSRGGDKAEYGFVVPPCIVCQPRPIIGSPGCDPVTRRS